ncbi:hypothetical protein PspLS_08831 [Pyricularia sp. CBS 133598]|nr:hypothetical protein PspLS_08831 [Pyricularia sp. CBS 133598]
MRGEVGGQRSLSIARLNVVIGSSDENGESRMLRLTTEGTGFERICICSHSADAGQAVSTRTWDFSELLGGFVPGVKVKCGWWELGVCRVCMGFSIAALAKSPTGYGIRCASHQSSEAHVDPRPLFRVQPA